MISMGTLIKKARLLFDHTFIRFIFVGVINTLFGVGVYCLMIFIGCPYTLATLISTVLGVLWNFKTTGVLVFGSHDNKLIFRFCFCYCVLYFVNIGVIYLIRKTGLDDYWSGILATPIVSVASYLLLKKFVFNKNINKQLQ